MLAETQALLGAGTETTGNTLAVLTFHILSQPAVLDTLKTELQSAATKSNLSDDLLNFKSLEHLPYLQACIREALRLSTGVCSRLPRVNNASPTAYTTPSGKEYAFPSGTVISLSILDLHYNASIFPSPHTFDPSRWDPSTTLPEHLDRMNHAYAPFGRGARQCLGLELAKEEITLMAGNLFHRFDLELFETSARDVSIAHDYFAPFGPSDSKGVRVKVR